jgi:hypothetical protein
MGTFVRFSLSDSHSHLRALETLLFDAFAPRPEPPRTKSAISVPDGSRLSTNWFLRHVIVRSLVFQTRTNIARRRAWKRSRYT